jgi:LysR family hydrogen peroxide-inducible transcriptional activator
VVFESGQFSSLLALVRTGVGVSLVPGDGRKRPAMRFVRVSDSGATRTIAALTLRGRAFSRAQRAFLSSLRA